MHASHPGSTDPQLLKRVSALRDDPAWREFFERYNPFVRARCSVYGLDADSVDELCQRIWVELTQRLQSYQYDPGGSFRGWLRRLCHHRATDLYRERDQRCSELLDSSALACDHIGTEDSSDSEKADPRLLHEALRIQEGVKARVKPSRWEAFWRVVIDGESVKDVAASLGLKYATVYAGVNHVAELLQQEGRRRKRELGLGDRSDLMEA
jgi:RNA polymerase sigma factor (sigma-70 family)